MKWLLVVLVLSNGQQYIVDDKEWTTKRECESWLAAHPEIINAPVSSKKARASCVQVGAM